MEVMSVQDFRDQVTEMIGSKVVVLITHEGVPMGFFIPWTASALPDELRRELVALFGDKIREQPNT
jgi:hypothetical protein